MESTSTTTSSYSCLSSPHSSISGEDGASEPSHPPLSQNDLCASFMEVGSLLFSARPDLFSNALEQLANQMSLALVKNPEVLRSTKNPCNQKQASCNCSACDDAESPQTAQRMKRAAFRKYVLPKNSPPEYYQCMDCGEQRSENSFQNDHLHFGKKPKVRWYCPLCMSFFAVTHRSGHIKCKHAGLETSSSAPSAEASKRFERSDNEVTIQKETTKTSSEKSSTVVVKEEQEEETCVVPASKRACCVSNEQEANYFQSSPVFSSSPAEEFLSEAPSFSTASFSSVNDDNSSGLFSEDVLPAFRCPSYVIMPDMPSSNFLFK